MGSGWDLFQLAYRNSMSRSLPVHDFFRVQVPCSIFLGGGRVGDYLGGRRGEFYCCNLNHDTRHNLITWNRLQTNICFFASHSRLPLLSVKIIYSKGNITRHQTHF